MLRRALIAAAATSALITVAVADTRLRDVLDTPAVKSPLAVRALINGLAAAGTRIVAVGQRGHVLPTRELSGSCPAARPSADC